MCLPEAIRLDIWLCYYDLGIVYLLDRYITCL